MEDPCDVIYGWEKLWKAVRCVALGQGTLEERVREASEQFLSLPLEHLPHVFHDDFVALKAELLKVESGNGKRLVAVPLSPDQAERLSAKILEIFIDFCFMDPLHKFHEPPDE